MERFSIWAEWELDEPVSDDLLLRVDTSWPSDDESFCSGPANDEASVLSLTFEVEAATFGDAAAAARSAIERLASTLELRGHMRPLKGYTETHHFTET